MITTVEMMRITFENGYANLVVTYDSSASDPITGVPEFEGNLISVVATNTSLTHTVTATAKRGNGQAAMTRTLPPQTTQTYTGGGAIKTVQDIPLFALGE